MTERPQTFTEKCSASIRFLREAAASFENQASRSTEDITIQAMASNARNCRNIAEFLGQILDAAPEEWKKP